MAKTITLIEDHFTRKLMHPVSLARSNTEPYELSLVSDMNITILIMQLLQAVASSSCLSDTERHYID